MQHTLYLPHPNFLVKVIARDSNKSWFALRDPASGEISRHADSEGGNLNMFFLSTEPPLWHTIYSDTERWSYGVHLNDQGAQQLLRVLNGHE